MLIYQVSPWEVHPSTEPHPRDVHVQKLRLSQEGQIEPIVVRNMVPDRDEWAYADEQVIAARELGWPTILVTY
jgi:hypothetical protein